MECQGTDFVNSFCVFSVPGYDIVLGMDWLESLPPMWVDLVKKSIRYRQNGKRVVLRGVKANTRQCRPISLTELQELAKDRAVEHIVQLNLFDIENPEIIPIEIEQVLQEHAARFETPTGLPPHRPYDHHITLLPECSQLM